MKETVVTSFGRMNPMTNGHEKLADKIKNEAFKRKADAKLYLSHSTNPKKDPLDYATKVKFAKKAFGPMVQNSTARTIIEVAKELTGKYKTLVVVVGSDRIPEFENLLNKYNGKDFTFETIEVISAGERDPDAEGVTGMSGSKMRGFVASDDFNSFKQGVPSKLSDKDAKALFDAVKRGMNLKEELEQNEAVLSYSARMGRANRARRMAKRLARARAMSLKRSGDAKTLQRRAIKRAYQMFRDRLAGGKHYADLSAGEKITIDTRLQKITPVIKKIATRLIPQVRQLEIQRRQHMAMRKEDVNASFLNFIVEKPTLPQDKDVKDKEGTQPSKYYRGLDKNTKDARASHFAVTGPKSDSDKSAYRDAPGDKEAREKGMPQSKHTLKFKQMYGEAVDKKEMSRLDQLVRMGLADKALLTVIKRSVEKLKSGDTLSPTERNATNDLLTTLLDMVTSSDALFRMTKTQLQKESIDDYGDEYDDEPESDGISMAQIELANIADDAEDLIEKLDSMSEEPDQWVLSKITKAADYISTVCDYLEFQDSYEDDGEDEEDDGEFSGELDDYLDGVEAEDFGQYYEEFKPLLEEIEGLKKKAEKSGISYSILKKVYDRGMAAWQGGHRPGTTPQQWAFARVNSFITKGSGTWGKADSDLAAKVRSNEEFSKFAEALEWGTDAMRQKYASDTPGQPTDVQIADHQKGEPCCDDCIEEGSDGSTCWDGYKQVGTKMKNGKSVPNCVPVSEDVAEEVDWEQVVNEAEYQGKSVKLNDPFRTPDGPKKFGVYTMGPNGKVVIVRFGDPNMEIKRDDPERRASYRARHGCDNPGPKWKANYWSCYQWRAGSKVDS